MLPKKMYNRMSIRDILLYFLVLSLLVLQAIRQYIIEVTPLLWVCGVFPILYTFLLIYTYQRASINNSISYTSLAKIIFC